MRFILLGASGFTGYEFRTQLRLRGHSCIPIGRNNCDYYQPGVLQHLLKSQKPDALINCAGYTGKPNVDACELDKTNCLQANSVLPGIISDACEALDIPWGHVSSGCIFTGRHRDGNGFSEIDTPNFSFRQNNCSFYSGTKALGEEVLSNAKQCYVWRMRIPFSNIDSDRNYLSKLMRYRRLLEAENSLTNLNEFVAAAIECFERSIPYGIYNMTNPGSVMTSDVVQLIRRILGHNTNFEYFASESAFMQQAAKAPRSNCVLDSSKALSAGLKLSPVLEALEKSLNNWQPEANTLRLDSKHDKSIDYRWSRFYRQLLRASNPDEFKRSSHQP